MPGCGVANAAGIQEQQAAVVDERIHARNQIGPPHVARGAAAGRVDDRDAVGRRVREDVPGGVAIDDVGTDDLHVTGRPLRALTMPPTSQPPSSASAASPHAAVRP